MQIYQGFLRCFFPILLLFSTVPLYAFDNLSGEDIKSLFSGYTVEGNYLEGAKQGVTNYYSEPFINYFVDNGKVYSVQGKTKKSGVWRATEEGLCINWNDTKEKCAPIYKDDDHYKQQKKNKIGKIKWTRTYTTFTPGDTEALQDR